CAGNTMAMAITLLGMSPMGVNDVPATDPEKAAAAFRCGELAMRLLRDDLRSSRIITRAALENAIAAVAATGGSTNGVLHLLAIAREAGVPLSIDDFDAIAAKTPILADLKPGGRYTAVDMYRAGGTALLAARMREAGLLQDGPTASGESLFAESERAAAAPAQEVVRPVSNPLKDRGGFAILRGSLAPEGCVVKLAGHARVTHEGPA